MNHLLNTPMIPQVIKRGIRLDRELIKKLAGAGCKTVGDIEMWVKAHEIIMKFDRRCQKTKT